MSAWIPACLVLGLVVGCGSDDGGGPGGQEPEAPRCGDGTVDAGEVCDDGNVDPCLGGCSADCQEVVTVSGCGDGVVCGAEVCDDGNQLDTAGTCSADCSLNQLCPDGTATLDTGPMPDTIDLSGCTTIVGDLNVGDELTSLTGLERLQTLDGDLHLTQAVPSLAPLASLTSVRGLVVDAATSTSLAGLEGLTRVASLTLTDNPNLADLSALSGLSGELAALTVSGNPQLTDLVGLGGITGVTGDLSVRDDAALASLEGLEGVTHVDGTVELEQLGALTSVAGLAGVTAIGGDLTLGYSLGDSDLSALTTLDGLSGLETIGGVFSLNHSSVTTLAPLSNITAVGGVEVGDAGGLTRLDGAFDAVTHIPGSIGFTDNYALVSLDGFSSLETLGGALWLFSNGLESITGLGRLREVCIQIPEDDQYLASSWGCLFVTFNYSLADLSGLSSVAVVHGNVDISLDAVTDLSPLDALTTIEGGLTLGSLHAVTDLSGMNGLTRLDGELYFDWAEGLVRISGLNGLASVGGLRMSSLFALEQITGFSSLTTVNGDLAIGNSTVLASLAGLDGITTVTGNLDIRTNTALPQCEAERYAARLGTGLAGTATLEQNNDTATCN